MRKKPTRSRPLPIAGVKPWACVTLNVDPGESCGVAIYDQGVYYDSAHGDGYDSVWIQMWLDRALFVARPSAVNGGAGLPIVLVLEQPPGGGRPYSGTRRNFLGSASVIGSRKLWLRAWQKSEHTVKRYRVNVYPPTWRAPVLGALLNPQPRERVRAAIEKHANAGLAAEMQQDESAAICIGIWASNAPAIAAVLPERLRLECAS